MSLGAVLSFPAFASIVSGIRSYTGRSKQETHALRRARRFGTSGLSQQENLTGGINRVCVDLSAYACRIYAASFDS